MNDDYQVRRDLEKLYKLIYGDTTEESVNGLKADFENFVDNVENNYATNDALSDLMNQVSEKTNQTEFDDFVNATLLALASKQDKTEWETLLNSGGLKLQRNGIHCRLIINIDSYSVDNQWSTVTSLSSYSNYLPQTTYSKLGIHQIMYNISEDHRLRVATYSTAGTFELTETLEWTI